MELDLILRNGRIVTPEGVLENGAVCVASGKVVSVMTSAAQDLRARKEVDLRGLILFPGVFDPHCHLGSGDERTYEYMSESFAEDTKDFLLGGVTSFATTTVLAKNSLIQNFEDTQKAAAGRSRSDFRITNVILTDEHVTQIPAAIRAGVRSFKFYCGYCLDQAEKMGMSRDGVPPDLFFRACEQVAAHDPSSLMMIHAEEPHVRRMLADRFKAQGRNDLIAWAEHSPQWSESVQVSLYSEIANQVGVPLYVVHISRAPTLDIIAYYRSRGHRIYAESTPVFLSTTAQEREACGCGFKAKIQPPIRFAEDQNRLWAGVLNGEVQAVGTDTIPYTSKYKKNAGFWDARPGLNIQTIDTLPLLYTEGVRGRGLGLVTLARITSQEPARLFGAGHVKGKIANGYDADFVVFDPEQTARLGLHRMRGRSDYSLWEDKEVQGIPVATYLRGSLVMQNGELTDEVPMGRFIAPEFPR